MRTVLESRREKVVVRAKGDESAGYKVVVRAG